MPAKKISQLTEATVIGDNDLIPMVVGTATRKVKKSSLLAGIGTITHQALTDGATITWNIANGPVATVTLGGNRTLAITNPVVGTGVLIVKQDATGSRTLALPVNSEVINGGNGAFTPTATANAVDIISYLYDGATFWWNYGKNYS